MSAVDVRSLPWSWYTDPAVLQLERERIFRRSWQYVGHTGDVPEPGSFAATRVGDIPVVLVRDREDTLRAFLNVCRHRGSIVCEGSGRRETLQCPYHAWTYGLDGRLITAPRGNKEGGIEKEELGLVPLQLGTWGPLIFVNPDTEAGPLDEFLDGIPERIAERGRRPGRAAVPPALRVRARLQLEDLLGELPRVLPLPDRAPWVLRGHGRLGRRVPPRDEFRPHDPIQPAAEGAERSI